MSDPRQSLDAYAIREHFSGAPLGDIAPRAFAALRAVLDLHVRHQSGPLPASSSAYCSHDEQDWPCETVQAITSALDTDALEDW